MPCNNNETGEKWKIGKDLVKIYLEGKQKEMKRQSKEEKYDA